MTCMKCPASMCPLIAPNGSPWTGEYAAKCPGHDDISADGCAWWSMGCRGGGMMQMVNDAEKAEGFAQVAGPNKPKRSSITVSKQYDCPKEDECRWQEQSSVLCPPREALSRGIDPRVCLF